MELVTPLSPDPGAVLPRVNPVAKIAAALIVIVVLFASVDPVTAAIVVVGLLAVVPFSGLTLRAMVARAWLIAITALSIGVFNVIFAPAHAGPTLFDAGPLAIGRDTLVAGIGLAIRLVAIALAGMLAVATSEPVDVADALVQQLRVSPRFAIGALAALRLVPLLAYEWQVLGMARRARGVEAGRSPIAAVRLFGSKLFALLVAAIRRGSRLALAMEARGFGAEPCRTVARPQRMRPWDWGWIAAAAGLALVAVAVSVLLGTWRPLIG